MEASGIISEILKFLNMNAKTFSESLGYNRPQWLYDILNGKTLSISPKVSRQIISVYPQINKGWLHTGEGRMLNIDSDDNKVETPYLENITKLINLNSDLMDKINLKDKEKEMLIIQLNDLKERNIKLTKELDTEKAENIKLTGIIKELANKLGDQCPSEYSDIRVRAAG